MFEKPVLHDGQGDAVPCQCPACRSPFVPRSVTVHAAPLMAFDPETGGVVPLSGVIRAGDVIRFTATKACPVWCGDACTCGRGPESADLDPTDIAGMRAIEGRDTWHR